MVDYGISGDFHKLANIADDVTGGNGVIAKTTRDAIGLIPDDVDVNDVTTVVNNVADNSLEIDANTLNKIHRQLANKIKPGAKIGTMNPLDAFDLQKQLEATGHQYLNTSTYLTGNVRNEQIGQLYLAAADELGDSINKAVGKSNIVQNMDKSAAIAKLQQISPQLADDFANATTIRDLRSLQAPFVRMAKMIDLTEQAQLSAANKLGGRLMSRILGPFSSIADPITDVVGSEVKQLQTPLLTKLSNINIPKPSLPNVNVPSPDINKIFQILSGRVGSETGRTLSQ
jgi:hypothetical protein